MQKLPLFSCILLRNEGKTAQHDTPLLLDAFEQLLPSPCLLKKHVDGLNQIPPGGTFDWERLNDMSAFLRSRSAVGSDHGGRPHPCNLQSLLTGSFRATFGSS